MDGYEIAYNQIINSEVFKSNETYGECIVHLLFKYEHETEFENTYQIADIMQDGACWFNDWWEGQQNIIVKGFLFTDELPPTMFLIYKIISLILCKMSIVFICRFVIL